MPRSTPSDDDSGIENPRVGGSIPSLGTAKKAPKEPHLDDEAYGPSRPETSVGRRTGSHRHYSPKGPRSRAAERPPRSIIYLVSSSAGDVKVGVTNDVKRRMYELGRQRGPVTLLYQGDGDTRLETEIRKRLSAFHVGGDWYRGAAREVGKLVRELGARATRRLPRKPLAFTVCRGKARWAFSAFGRLLSGPAGEVPADVLLDVDAVVAVNERHTGYGGHGPGGGI